MTPCNHYTEEWAGFRAGLDIEATGKSFVSAGDRTPVVQSVVSDTILTELVCFKKNELKPYKVPLACREIVSVLYVRTVYSVNSLRYTFILRNLGKT
jgi:hypothetical protein